MHQGTYLCIDLGGTKTLVAQFTPEGKRLSEIRFETPKTYEQFMSHLAEAVASLPTADYLGCCAAVPGRVDRKKGKLLLLGNLPWRDKPIASDISEAFSIPKVVIENDANLAGLGEAALHKDKYRSIFYLTFSTGIGSAWIVDGKLQPQTLNAEAGHMLFNQGSKYIIWEKIASGKAIVTKYGRRASDIDKSEVKIWDEIAENFATGIINCCAMLTPELVIIGGGVGSHFNKFQKPLMRHIEDLCSEIIDIPKIIEAKRPEEAVIYGCYEYIRQHLR